mmetsp:Transcript_7092/g.15495  ORF Transcript_7092/g.15495 Transcript_7092/m.15495 type:complete len:101 (-) Transcript_7092:85-387(-)
MRSAEAGPARRRADAAFRRRRRLEIVGRDRVASYYCSPNISCENGTQGSALLSLSPLEIVGSARAEYQKLDLPVLAIRYTAPASAVSHRGLPAFHGRVDD